MLRRIISTILVALMALCLYAQPAGEVTTGEAEVTQVRVAALKGPTAMGLVHGQERGRPGGGQLI